LIHQPFFVSQGKGAHIYDLDGNKYIDYVLAYGPLTLGHAPEPVIQAVTEQVSKGTMYAAGFEKEYLLAEQVVKMVPCADMVRFCSSGSEAVHFVLRLVRAYTGRNKVIKFEGHFHGWMENIFVSVKPTPPMGLPNAPWKQRETPGQTESATYDLIILPWNDLEIVEKTLKHSSHEIAAIILEPVGLNSGALMPVDGFLEGLRELTIHYGVLLIFDEIITGFRLALGGAQEYFGVIPDMCTFAKGFAAGLPMAGFGGKRQIMDLVASNIVPHFGTYNGNPLCIAGALAALKELARNNGEAIKHMKNVGIMLKEGLNSLFKEFDQPFTSIGCEAVFSIISPRLSIQNYRDTLKLDIDRMHRFWRDMFDEGVWFQARGNFMISAAHTEEDIKKTLEAARKVLKQYASTQ
jgi:glutamate-1-semialdehyde 2,1-aminomutase